MNDEQIESEIQAKDLTAPRITPADIQANIITEVYFTALDGATASGDVFETKGNKPNVLATAQSLSLLTFCVLVLRNGFTITGESACASPENFDAEIGQKIARQNAVNKIWPLMVYELKCRLAKGDA